MVNDKYKLKTKVDIIKRKKLKHMTETKIDNQKIKLKLTNRKMTTKEKTFRKIRKYSS